MKKDLGILCHVSSLVSKYGIGDFGKSSIDFIDFLSKAKLDIWQILPLTETNIYNCPYGSLCFFSLDLMFIDPDDLLKRRLIKKADLRELLKAPKTKKVNYPFVKKEKIKLLEIAYKNIDDAHMKKLKEFIKLNPVYLKHAYFKVLLEKHNTTDFRTIAPKLWSEESIDGKKFYNDNLDNIYKYAFWQYLLLEQWTAVRKYASLKGIKILGDMPIYPEKTSFDVFANPDCFLLDKKALLPTVYGGVPADNFCPDGQNWNTCVYDWDYLKANRYDFMINKIKMLMKFYDILRLDHYLGYVHHYEFDAKDSSKNKWVKKGGDDFFNELKNQCDLNRVVVEDLGLQLEEAIAVKNKYDLKGMCVLQSADNQNPEHYPQNVEENTIFYLGTHDNNTFIGFLTSLTDSKRKEFLQTTNIKDSSNEQVLIDCVNEMIKSKSKTIILQIQDSLLEGEESRMNMPGQAAGWWEYKVPKNYKKRIIKFLKRIDR